MKNFKIDEKEIGPKSPAYFIADLAANHDGELNRAKDLISLAKEAGADAVKFQHFKAEKIVSDYGFRTLGNQLSHQSKWEKSVYEVYQDASIDWQWTEELCNYSKREKIHFFSSPYDFEYVDKLEEFVPAYKIGSGDITWDEMLIYIAKKVKPVILATGASRLQEVVHAVETLQEYNSQVALLQCNTNYTGSRENFKYISLNVLKAFQVLFPDIVLGLSDHTPGCSTVLGAIALGAKIIEKHFTDDNNRPGPDHSFSMNPKTWRDMVERSKELELSLGNTIKKMEPNEKDTVVLQRRCLRAARDLQEGHVILESDIEVLRPAPREAIQPNHKNDIIGRQLKSKIVFGEFFTWENIL